MCDRKGFRPMELLMLVCRTALLMYSLFLFPLPLYFCKWLWFEIVSLLLYFCCKESEYVLMWNCEVCYEREGFECTLHIAVFLATATQLTIILLALQYYVEYIFKLLIWHFCIFGTFEWIYTNSFFKSRLELVSSWILMQMDDFILTLFLLFLVESIPS